MDRKELLRASVLCARSLRANIKSVDAPDGRPRSLLVAGGKRLHSLRTPDFCFAAGGLLKIGEFQVVRDTLEALFTHQREDGLFPILLDSDKPWVRIGRMFFGSRILFRTPLAPLFIPAVETTSLVVWTACRYALEDDRPAWAGLHISKLELALSNEPKITSPFMTQLQHWMALNSFADLLESLGRKRESEKRRSEASIFKRKLESKYWDEGLGLFKGSIAANLAAAAWGFTTNEQNSRIIRAIDRSGAWTQWGPKEDGSLKLWIVALGLRVLHKSGQHTLLDRTFTKLLSLLERDGGVSEEYDPKTGKEARRSEKPFSWSAGMLLETLHELLKTDEVSCVSRS